MSSAPDWQGLDAARRQAPIQVISESAEIKDLVQRLTQALTPVRYSPNDQVVELTAGNFQEKVIQSNELWMVEFYSPWCGRCKTLSPEWIKAANALVGVVRVACVDMTEHPSISPIYGIEEFPAIKFFGGNKQSPLAYAGQRDANSMVEFALKEAQSVVRARLGGAASTDSTSLPSLPSLPIGDFAKSPWSSVSSVTPVEVHSPFTLIPQFGNLNSSSPNPFGSFTGYRPVNDPKPKQKLQPVKCLDLGVRPVKCLGVRPALVCVICRNSMKDVDHSTCLEDDDELDQPLVKEKLAAVHRAFIEVDRVYQATDQSFLQFMHWLNVASYLRMMSRSKRYTVSDIEGYDVVKEFETAIMIDLTDGIKTFYEIRQPSRMPDTDQLYRLIQRYYSRYDYIFQLIYKKYQNVNYILDKTVQSSRDMWIF